MANENEKNTKKALSELENLFLLDLIPESTEEAHEILRTAGVETTNLKEEGREIFRNILLEFEDDWRNISDSTLEDEASNILNREIYANLSRETLLERIQSITQALSAKGLSSSLPAGILHRNLEKDTNQDLASLLRQVQFIAEQAGIDLGDL
jgi:hypothetical protein